MPSNPLRFNTFVNNMYWSVLYPQYNIYTEEYHTFWKYLNQQSRGIIIISPLLWTNVERNTVQTNVYSFTEALRLSIMLCPNSGGLPTKYVMQQFVISDIRTDFDRNDACTISTKNIFFLNFCLTTIAVQYKVNKAPVEQYQCSPLHRAS